MRPRSNWTPAIVSNRADRTGRETNVNVSDVATPGPSFAAFYVAFLDNRDGLSADTSNASDPTIQRQADRRFAIGVAFALALPVLIGLGVYIVMTIGLRAS